jgi:hypothetical protein
MDVTLFEIHLDGAQFGPATIGGESEAEDATAGPVGGGPVEGGSGERSAPRALRFVPVLVAVAVGYAAMRRFRGGGDEDALVATPDAEAVEIEA